MSRATTFERLDSLPTWMKQERRPKGKRNVVAAHLRDDLATRLAAAMETVGLSASDLCRAGLMRVISEVEHTGRVVCAAMPDPPKPKGATSTG